MEIELNAGGIVTDCVWLGQTEINKDQLSDIYKSMRQSQSLG